MTHDSTTPAPTGFSIIPNWMVADERVTGPMVSTYAALASYADREGSCWPSLRALGIRAKVGRTTLLTALQGLQSLGVLQVVQRARQDGGQTSNLYRIAVHERGLSAPIPPVRHTDPPVRESDAPRPSGGPQEQDPHEQVPPLAPPGGAALIEPPAPEEDHFSVFWAAYPRKVGKPQAERAWKKAVKGGTHWSVIVGGALAYAEDPNRDAAFTAHPSTWLNREGWNDDALPERPPVPGAPVLQPALPSGTMSERVEDCTTRGRAHRPIGDGTCMLCETRLSA